MAEYNMRTVLKEGTMIRVPGNVLYQIVGKPIGEGGGSIIYPACRYLPGEGHTYQKSPILYALKECFPLSSKYRFFRNDTGEIQPVKEEEKAKQYLARTKEMLLAENTVTGKIYHTGFRLTPILESFQEIEISQDGGGTFRKACNSISVMESLSEKGYSLKTYLKERKHLPVDQAFRIVEQVLYALREVHNAGYLHLDLQDGNIFLKGMLEDGSGMVSLIDFGSARKRMGDGLSETIQDCVLHATPGFSDPKMYSGNDGTLRLGVTADIYSVGYLMLLMLTGHRFSVKELSLNRTGRYIPRFSIRKTRCPKHLTERMQAIVSKALANAPKDRYPDTEEMLKDVTAFIAMLAPYKNPLSTMKYDAFICYKHGLLDTAAAKELRNALERYKGNRLFGKKPMKRVFLDEGELASCADFGEGIREALKNSAWLVIICSKDTKESPWVNDEIKTFLEYHDTSRILAVVTEGEPKEVFPEALIQCGIDETRLFAADARAKNTIQVLKKVKGDVKLKIAAPILNTTFDTLKQRKKVYQIKQAFSIVCLCLLALSVFFGYAAAKSREIANQAVKLANEHKAALQGQALYLSEQAKKSYEKHDTMTAVQQALQAYDLLAEDELFLPELIQILTKAMDIYTLPSDAQESMTAVGIFPFEEKSSLEEYFLDQEGKYLFTADDSHVSIWNTKTYQCEKTVTVPQSIKKFDESFLLDQQNQYLLVLRDEINCYDYEKETSIWNYKFDEPLAGIAVSDDKTRIVAATGQKLYIFEAVDGTLLQTSVCSEIGSLVLGNTSIAISSDKKEIAFVRTKEGEEEASHLFEVVLYDVVEEQYTVISSWKSKDPSGFAEICLHFTDSHKLFASYSFGVNTVYEGSVYKYYSEKKKLEAFVYDLDQKDILWKADKDYMALDENIMAFDTAYSEKHAILLIYGNRCEILDQATGETLDLYETDAPIIQAWLEEEKVTLVLENGDLLYYTYGEDRLVGYAYFPEHTARCCKSGSDYYIRSESAIIKYQNGVYDLGYETCASLPGNLQAPVQDTQISWKDQRYCAYIESQSVVIEDKKSHSKKLLEFDQSPLSLYLIPDSEKLLIGLEDKVSLYDLSTQTLSSTEEFEHEYTTFGSAAWQMIDASTVIYVGNTFSYVLGIKEDAVGILYSLKDFEAYDSKEDVFYFLSTSYDMDRLNEGIFSQGEELGKIPRYQTEEIIQLARERMARR